ncbi:MAG TPA: M36 family metallopeptidase [Candidatus Bathyarchaeia archaeon]|nr:M36 family metallopeptidase [Candidatus Bathyarchaeia archaeon]
MQAIPRGRVYTWIQDPARTLGGRVTLSDEPLQHLDDVREGPFGLSGRHARVRNAGAANEPGLTSGNVRAVPIGDAQPNSDGNFLFEPGRGGGRLDKVLLAAPDFRWRYIQASHFGEVNTYFHLDRIGSYIDGLLHELGAPSLPRVVAAVNAHHAATEEHGLRDGVRGPRSGRWLPFQGGHYRLPSRRYDVFEFEPLAPDGEIHLGPGWQLLHHGALVERVGGPYRANASHNAGIIYHEYGHHITRHTADFQANALRSPNRQKNRKSPIDEGTCDYWAAAMLGTPHIWAWHRRHDEQEIHPRSLSSSKTMADYDYRPEADEHLNGTIWGAALWDLRTRFAANEPDGSRKSDLLVLQALLLLGKLTGPQDNKERDWLLRMRTNFGAGLAVLLQADDLLNAGRNHSTILSCFQKRGIAPEPALTPAKDGKLCLA